MWGIFHRRYSNQYDGETAAKWVKEYVLQHPVLYYAARTDDAFLIALLSNCPWFPNEMECHVIVTCADLGKVWQTLPLLRACVAWAKKRKAVRWNFQSDTDADIAPLMKRLGARRLDRFQIDLAELGE